MNKIRNKFSNHIDLFICRWIKRNCVTSIPTSASIIIHTSSILPNINTKTHTHTVIYIYLYIKLKFNKYLWGGCRDISVYISTEIIDVPLPHVRNIKSPCSHDGGKSCCHRFDNLHQYINTIYINTYIYIYNSIYVFIYVCEYMYICSSSRPTQVECHI